MAIRTITAPRMMSRDSIRGRDATPSGEATPGIRAANIAAVQPGAQRQIRERRPG
jgi:hypothetical protein